MNKSFKLFYSHYSITITDADDLLSVFMLYSTCLPQVNNTVQLDLPVEVSFPGRQQGDLCTYFPIQV